MAILGKNIRRKPGPEIAPKKRGLYYQGFFHPKNPKKYLGDPTQIVFRSLLEWALMKKLDMDPRILEWSSENIVIPYRSPIDEKIHRYFVDIYMKYYDRNNKLRKMIVEVKPEVQTIFPRQPKRKSKHYIQECKTWEVNQAKWAAATRYAKKMGMEFKIMTEYDIGTKKRKK